MELFITALSKANMIHDIGVMDHCNNVSPEVVVLANGIIEALKHYTRGVEVNDNELALDVIKKVGPMGAYLNKPHTMNNFRKIWYPSLFSRRMKNLDKSDVREKIKSKIKDIMENHEVPQLDAELLKELDKWTKRLEAR